MVPERTHPCPRCELRFATTSECQQHLDEEHAAPTSAPAVASGRLVVAVDPARSAGAEVALAAALAVQAGLVLDLVALPPRGHDRAGTDAHLRARAHEVRRAGVATVTWSVLRGDDPAAAVLAHLVSSTETLLCLGTRARSGIGELIFGSVSQRVLRVSPVPVVLAGPHHQLPDGPFARVVACVDGSDLEAPVSATATHLGARLDVPVTTWQAVPEWWDERSGRLVDPPALSGEAATSAVLDRLGEAAGTIAVVGTEGRGGLDRILDGSVAVEVAREARGPVVVVPRRAAGTATGTLVGTGSA